MTVYLIIDHLRELRHSIKHSAGREVEEDYPRIAVNTPTFAECPGQQGAQGEEQYQQNGVLDDQRAEQAVLRVRGEELCSLRCTTGVDAHLGSGAAQQQQGSLRGRCEGLKLSGVNYGTRV